jgi:hypothetical protein
MRWDRLRPSLPVMMSTRIAPYEPVHRPWSAGSYTVPVIGTFTLIVSGVE